MYFVFDHIVLCVCVCVYFVEVSALALHLLFEFSLCSPRNPLLRGFVCVRMFYVAFPPPLCVL